MAKQVVRPRYMLYWGQLEVVKMPHTYARRALGTLRRVKWHQLALGGGIDELWATAERNKGRCMWKLEAWETGERLRLIGDAY